MAARDFEFPQSNASTREAPPGDGPINRAAGVAICRLSPDVGADRRGTGLPLPLLDVFVIESRCILGPGSQCALRPAKDPRPPTVDYPHGDPVLPAGP
jgi:hypothetical protein